MTQRHFRARIKPLPVFTDAQLRSVTVPVRAMLGGSDIVFDSGISKQRLELCMSQAQIHILPAAGHGLVDATMEVIDFIGLEIQSSDALQVLCMCAYCAY